MPHKYFRFVSIALSFFAVSLPYSRAAEPAQTNEIAIPSTETDSLVRPAGRAFDRVSPLPKGIVPASRPIKFPRNEKIRIAEPSVIEVAGPAAEVPLKSVKPAIQAAAKKIQNL